MSDLLERLRGATDGWSGDAFAVDQDTAEEAATEIERLQAEVIFLQTAYANCNQRVCQLLTEKLATAPIWRANEKARPWSGSWERKMREEPKIVINGHTLSAAQAMTVRVAVSLFNPDCGDDKHGIELTATYKKYTEEIVRLMGLK